MEPDVIQRARNIFRLLEQDEVWIDKEGIPHRIDEMDVSYVVNVVAFLQRRVQYLLFHYELGALEGFPGELPDGVDESVDEEWDEHATDPETWLNSTPLLKKLRARELSAPLDFSGKS